MATKTKIKSTNHPQTPSNPRSIQSKTNKPAPPLRPSDTRGKEYPARHGIMQSRLEATIESNVEYFPGRSIKKSLWSSLLSLSLSISPSLPLETTEMATQRERERYLGTVGNKMQSARILRGSFWNQCGASFGSSPGTAREIMRLLLLFLFYRDYPEVGMYNGAEGMQMGADDILMEQSAPWKIHRVVGVLSGSVVTRWWEGWILRAIFIGISCNYSNEWLSIVWLVELADWGC